MKKLEMVESERDDLLEENAKLKGTTDTSGVSYQDREVDERNKSSIQSSESEKQDSKKKMAKAFMEIDQLRSSLQKKIGIYIHIYFILYESVTVRRTIGNIQVYI
ncbi:PREDICTED: uncharacterized protein LOC109593182 isoform X1 [Amphimedon queenslandica]|uniref:Uncharacterized protein n=1 Tax=Amphimedon queenslandica TaxID=400682 RepID=A0AAN0K449_AMPQE|nr:PREDICTED: uncharacterized protein LOC109593182 isoform X1 [Amphimedon queenslandica]|eukprot:XP_019863939.1 PREDICTED: uncharacterized protein LOC109593182 isoform X1 [Amphimedon queenslandica]